jgi:signal transduction histidine kinase
MNLIELRKLNILLNQKNLQLENKNEEIERFAYVAAHDLKSPLNSIKGLIDLLLKKDTYDNEVSEMLELIRGSSEKSAKLITELLDFSKIDKVSVIDKSEINPHALIEDLKSVILPDDTISIQLITKLDKIEVNPTGVNLVLQNLVTNSIKYSDKPKTKIDIGITEHEHDYEFFVKDNGPGIDSKFKDKVFNPFQILTPKDRFGKRGTGLGLANVKKVLEKMGGTIKFESEIGNGTKFIFTVKK